MRLSLYFDTQNLWSANFSRIVITALVYAIEFHLLNERDLIATLAHNIPTSEPRWGELPLVSAHEASTIFEPPYLYPENV